MNRSPDTDRYYTPQELADTFRISLRAVHAKISSGAWPADHISDRTYRIREDQYQAITELVSPAAVPAPSAAETLTNKQKSAALNAALSRMSR